MRALRLEGRQIGLPSHKVEMGKGERELFLESARRDSAKDGRRRFQHRRLRGVNEQNYVNIVEATRDAGCNAGSRVADMTQPLAVEQNETGMARGERG